MPNMLRYAQVLALLLGMSACGLAADPPTATGIRQIVSKHLTLHTDLPASADVDALGEVFDQAFGQWCAYFGVDAAEHADWHMRGFLMKSRERFETAGLVSPELPQFPNGWAQGDQLWFFDQTSVYYRRHLLLHEGTHAFMAALASGAGPPWFSEGMAELLATHRWQDGQLTLNFFPLARDDVPKWGRIEIVQTGFAERRAKSLSTIFAYDARAHLENEAYGWCWAAAAFLDGNPRYQARFRQLHRLAGEPDFAARVSKLFAEDWQTLNEDWQVFVANLDYGYDFQRMQFDYAAGAPLDESSKRVTVAADRGWQASGIRLEAGKKYQLTASGRYSVAQQPKVWACEPGGITIRYYHAQPLGILLAAVRSDDPQAKGSSGLTRPIVVGLDRTLSVDRPGTLYLRINDSAGSLADNAGTLSVEVSPSE